MWKQFADYILILKKYYDRKLKKMRTWAACY